MATATVTECTSTTETIEGKVDDAPPQIKGTSQDVDDKNQEKGTSQDVDVKNQTPTLRLKSPKQEKKIQWAEGTVDNEGMGKKSSKCCCIYKKPRMFGESSSEDDSTDDEDKCKAPKDYHKKSRKKPQAKHDHDGCNACD